MEVFTTEEILAVEHIDAPELGSHVGSDRLLNQRWVSRNRRRAWHDDSGWLAVAGIDIGPSKPRITASGRQSQALLSNRQSGPVCFYACFLLGREPEAGSQPCSRTHRAGEL